MSLTASPYQKLLSSANEFQALEFFWQMMMLGVQTSILVEVMTVHAGGVGRAGTVDVRPLVDQIDGDGNAVPHKTIYGRPYFRLQSGLSAIICDPQEGDIGKCVFCQRDISSVIAAAQAGSSALSGPPASLRLFNYADGLYVGGYLNATPTNYIEFLADGGINIVTTGPVNINGAIISTAGEITDASGVVLGTHVHVAGTLVAPDGAVTGETGEPVP